MVELICEIHQAVESEYKRASQQYGPTNNSDHESSAIIREELEEAKEEGLLFEEAFNSFWYRIKKDYKNNKELLKVMREHAERAAAEWVQVAAMCHKATLPKEEGTR